MEKLKAFERITEDSYAAQVQTSDIQVNRQLALNETNAWLETVESRLISVISGDGYALAAREFFSGDDVCTVECDTFPEMFEQAVA